MISIIFFRQTLILLSRIELRDFMMQDLLLCSHVYLSIHKIDNILLHHD